MGDGVVASGAELTASAIEGKAIAIRRFLLAVGVGGTVALLAWVALWLAVNI